MVPGITPRTARAPMETIGCFRGGGDGVGGSYLNPLMKKPCALYAALCMGISCDNYRLGSPVVETRLPSIKGKAARQGIGSGH